MKRILLFLFTLTLSFCHANDVLKESWNAFSLENSQFSETSTDQIATLANQWGQKVAAKLGVDEYREVNPKAVEKLLTFVQQNQPKFFMRHGEQKKSVAISHLPANEQKIAMMCLPDNMENTLTNSSIVELVEGMIVWNYMMQKSGKTFVVETSMNQRANLAANALAAALKTNPRPNGIFNCINYPAALPRAEILKVVPDGTLPWEKEKVDALIGAGTYDNITQEMQKILAIPLPDNTVFIALTHTQQINAVATLSDLPVTRLGNYGFIVLTKESKGMFADGIYAKSE